MAYYPYDPYYSPPHLSPPPSHAYRHRSHSRGHDNTTNVFVPASPDYRGRQIERIADEIQELRLSQSRGRHRAHSDLVYARSRSPSYTRLQEEIDRLKKDLDQSENKHNEEDHRKQIISQWENEQAEKKRKQKEEMERIKEQIRVDEIMAKEKADKQYKEFEAIQEKKRQDAELKARKEKEKADEATRENLAKAGYSHSQIERIMRRAADDAAADQPTIEQTTTSIVAYPGGVQPVYHHHGYHGHAAGDIIVGGSARPPVYPRAHRHDISTEVLKEYNIPYSYDQVRSTLSFLNVLCRPLFPPHVSSFGCRATSLLTSFLQADSNYIIIYREMDQAMFEVLHDKTKEYRGKGKKKLLIEAKRDRGGGLAFVRKKNSRSRSRSRNRGGGEKIIYVRGP
ncbi:hypothetical protein CAC42_7898 [Sphaceloma murrayae]|uniref:Uncharacterized protein n=1 Tax=Sphaceloma murrayae TaxID=2082308 RepID=A0A2K1QXZ7_9PEZI|nr:hypothetical protein CAC42_7898 [Sphaceloma murrayae]